MKEVNQQGLINLPYQTAFRIQELNLLIAFQENYLSNRWTVDNDLVNNMSTHSFLPGSWEPIYTKYSKFSNFK